MNLQKQPNKFSCIPTSFAMVMDMDVHTILKDLGHDGEEMLDDNQHRGFHPTELIYYAYKKGWYCIPFETNLQLVAPNGKVYDLLKNSDNWKIRFSNVLNNSIGVLVGTTLMGKYHAVAWDSGKILDPNGTIYGLYDFNIEIFYKMIKSKI